MKPPVWNVSPYFTEVPELWRGVVFMAPLWEGIGPATAIQYDQRIGSGGGRWVSTDRGRAFAPAGNTSNTTTFDLDTPLSDITNGDHTFAALCRVASNPGSRVSIFTAGDAVHWIQIAKDSQTNRWSASWDDDATKIVNLVTLSGSVGNWVLISARRLSSTYYLDVQIIDTGVSGSSTNPTNNNFTIGGSTDDVKLGGSAWNTTETFSGDIYWVLVANRYFTDVELTAIAADPDIMLRPRMS